MQSLLMSCLKVCKSYQLKGNLPQDVEEKFKELDHEEGEELSNWTYLDECSLKNYDYEDAFKELSVRYLYDEHYFVRYWCISSSIMLFREFPKELTFIWDRKTHTVDILSGNHHQLYHLFMYEPIVKAKPSTCILI